MVSGTISRAIPSVALAMWFAVCEATPIADRASGPGGAVNADGVQAQPDQTLAVDREIAFWEARSNLDPYDYIALVKLGTSYLRKARDKGQPRNNGFAEEVLRRSLEVAPRPPYDGLVALAFALNAQHKFEDGARVAGRATSVRPQALTGYGALGDALFELGDIPGAQRAYDKLIDLDGGLFALTRRAKLKQIRGDTRGAIVDLHRAAEIGIGRGAPATEIARCFVTIGGLYFLRGAHDGAEKHYMKAQTLWPNGFVPLEHLAELHAAIGDFDRALTLYSQVVSQVSSPEIFEAIGNVHATLDDHDEARIWHDRAVQGYMERVTEGDASYYRHLALFYSNIRPEPKLALNWARKDFENRRDVYTFDTLAWALYRNRLFDEALAAANGALEHGTDDPSLWRHAAMIHQALGNGDAARRYRSRAVSITHNEDFD